MIGLVLPVYVAYGVLGWIHGTIGPSEPDATVVILSVMVIALTFLWFAPDARGKMASTINIGSDRIWFGTPGKPDLSLRVEQPGAVILLEDRQPPGVPSTNGDFLPTGRPRYFIGIGLGWRTPVPAAAFASVQKDLESRGIPVLPRRPSVKPPRTSLSVYQVPDPRAQAPREGLKILSQR
jgi:hypothetical protein